MKIHQCSKKNTFSTLSSIMVVYILRSYDQPNILFYFRCIIVPIMGYFCLQNK